MPCRSPEHQRLGEQLGCAAEHQVQRKARSAPRGPPPTYMTFGPMSASISRTRSNSWPRARDDDPEVARNHHRGVAGATGAASSAAATCARTRPRRLRTMPEPRSCSCRSRARPGLASSPAARSEPSHDVLHGGDRRRSIVIATSACSHACAGRSSARIPRPTNGSTAPGERFQTDSSCPDRSSRSAIGVPMFPNPRSATRIRALPIHGRAVHERTARRTLPASHHHPASVDLEVDTVYGAVLEQEQRRVGDLVHCHKPAGRRALAAFAPAPRPRFPMPGCRRRSRDAARSPGPGRARSRTSAPSL